MATDSINGPRPPIREIFKPKKTEVKYNLTQSSERRPFSEKLREVRIKIENILAKRESSDQPSQQTLKDLAEIKIPQDTEESAKPTPDQNPETTSQPNKENQPQQPPTEKPSVSEPIIHDHAADQAEISKITKTIQDLKEPTPQPTETTPEAPLPKLFPDRPSLYEQHHKAYDQELKTIDGKINRIKDIFELKKAGVKKARYTYDGLRARGITRDQIMKNDTDEFPRISRTLTTRGFDESEKEYRKIYYYRDLPKNIDRLYSIGEFDLDSFSSDKEFSRTETKASILSHYTDEQFQQTRDKLNDFHFLSGSYNIRFFYTKELPADIYESLLYLQKEYFSNPQNETKFKSFISSERHWSRDKSFDFLSHEGYGSQNDTTNFVKNLIYSGVNDDKKIEIPSELLKFAEEYELNFLRCLSTLETREQQKFLISESSNSSSSGNEMNLINSYFDSNLQPNIEFYSDFISSFEDINQKVIIPSEILNSIQDRNSKDFYQFISNLPNGQIQHYILSFMYKSNNQPNAFFNEGQLTYEPYFLLKDILRNPDIVKNPLKIDQIKNFITSETEQKIILAASKISDNKARKFFLNYTQESASNFLDKDGNFNSYFYEQYLCNVSNIDFSETGFVRLQLNPEKLSTFSPEDQKLWNNLIKLNFFNDKDSASFLISDKTRFIKDGEITNIFYQELAAKYPLAFINNQNREIWKIAFGDEIINKLLDNLPKSTDEKRNAFTHNPYDRTSEFFKFLYDHSSQTNFRLDADRVKIATEYIKKYGLSKSPEYYNYFQSLYLYQRGKLETLPNELINNHITSIEELTKSMETVQRKSFGTEPIINISELTPFELNLLSITTGHSANRWTRIPLETIVSDFSTDLSNGLITPLSSEFHPETIKSASISIETDKKISDSPKLTALSQEILTSINSPNDVSSETHTISELFNQRIDNLSKEVQQSDPTKAKKQEFIQKQIDAFKQKVSEISESQSIDQLLNNLVTFNLNLGEDQEKFNSVLRQLVFKKVFDKHQNSPGWQESIAASLREDSSTVDTVNNMANLINNTIKDHVLNFETKNQDGYWDESTFETVKKYSSVFKKNLGFPSFINELNSYQESFVTTNLSQDQTIQMVPDRGLIGEMSGYMADVCYTKVYPLLKQYPDLVPYKFIANPESKSPEFIGSTLVFKVEDIDNNPVFLIRAFDIPNENSVEIGKFFESFVDHLTPIAKKLGIRKILAAGTAGTISNYSKTTNYVLSQYVNDKVAVELKDTFDFNSYNITHHCYQVRDLI